MSTSQANERRRKNSRIATPRLEQQERLHEASIKSLCADFETAYVENDKMAERIGGLEDVVDVQQERLESAEKHLSTAKSKCLRMQYGKGRAN